MLRKISPAAVNVMNIILAAALFLPNTNIHPFQETSMAVSKPQDWLRQFPLKAGSTGQGGYEQI